MQSKKSSSSWMGIAVLGLLSSAFVVACTIGSSDDDDDDIPLAGAAGKSTGGSTSTGGSGGKGGSAGAAGAAGAAAGTGGVSGGGTGGGAGQASTITCDPTTGTKLTSCSPSPGSTGDNLKCEKCRETKCCDEWKTCGSSSPDNACGFGGPQDDGELDCVRRCILAAREKSGGAVSREDEAACGATCKTTGPNCETAISSDTQAIYVCLKASCADDCFGGPLNP